MERVVHFASTRRERANGSRESGLSFVEMAVASAIFATLAGAIFSLISVGESAADTGIHRTRLEGRARMALDKIANDVRGAHLEPIAGGSDTTSSLVFKRRYAATGQDPDPSAFDLARGDVRWDDLPNQSIQVALADGEQPNGADDDGDGLIDEGLILRTTPALQTVLCQDVAPDGLTFRLVSPHKLEISLRLLGLDGRKNRITADASTLVFLRN